VYCAAGLYHSLNAASWFEHTARRAKRANGTTCPVPNRLLARLAQPKSNFIHLQRPHFFTTRPQTVTHIAHSSKNRAWHAICPIQPRFKKTC